MNFQTWKCKGQPSPLSTATAGTSFARMGKTMARGAPRKHPGSTPEAFRKFQRDNDPGVHDKDPATLNAEESE